MKYLALILAVLLLAGIGTLADYQHSKVPPGPTVSGVWAWEGEICKLVQFSPPVVAVLMGLSEHSASSEMLRGLTVVFSNRAGGEEFSGTASFNYEFKPGDVYDVRSRVTRLSTATAKAKSPPPGTYPNSVGWCEVQGINAVP